MRDHIDTVTNPNVSIPITFVSMLADNLPLFINIASFLYLVLLISHKGWQMYKEWKYKKDESVE